MATAKKLPSGNWRVRAYVGKKPDGSPDYKSITAKSKKEAERLAAVYDIELERKKESGATVGEVIDQYIENNSNILSPASIRKYTSMRRNSFKSIEEKPVYALKNSDYQAFINEFALDHAPKTVASVCGLLSVSLKSFDRSIVISLKKPSVRKTNITIPTDNQVKTLINSTGSESMKCAFLIGAALGLRRSEISALTWKDLDGNILHINKALVQDKNGVWVEKSTKTAAGTRDLEIPDYLKEQMLSLKKEDAKKTDRIIPHTPNSITKAFERATRRAKIVCRFHDLRHYNASIMLALGIPDKYAMQRMGHATSNMLKNIYQHLIDEKEKSVTDEVNDYMKRFGKS